MKTQNRLLNAAFVFSVVLLTACGGGGGGDGGGGAGSSPTPPPPPPPVNSAPTVASANADQTATVGVAFSYDATQAGTTFNDADNDTLTYRVSFSPDSNGFTASNGQISGTPQDAETTTVTITADDGNGGTVDDVFTIESNSSGSVTISGRITFDSVPHQSSSPFGLDYGGTVAKPARGVTVWFRDEAGSVLASGKTDNDGNYALEVASNTMVRLLVFAELAGFGADGQVQVTVADNTHPNTAELLVYGIGGTVADSGNGNSVRNLRAPSGWDGSSYTSARRAAAPFTIVDNIFDCMQLVRSVDSSAVFEPLRVFWSENNRPTPDRDLPNGELGGKSFFRQVVDNSGRIFNQIFILGAEDVDTDEYDRHVIVHEWGHYFEANFSRSDNIGGGHGVGDRLDMRVAFGEGWGTALAAMVLGDTNYRDAIGSGQRSSGVFDIESNTVTNPAGWYNEDSMSAILYDLFDSNNESPVDTISLGFAPIYQLMTNQQRTTPLFTSIFTFITALKEANPGSVAAINTLVAHHNIEAATIDAEGSTETNDAGNSNALPIYTELPLDGATVNLCMDDTFGTINKLASFRYLKVAIPLQGDYRIEATRSPTGTVAGDPDFRVYSSDTFDLVANADSEVEDSEILSVTDMPAGDYVVDFREFNFRGDITPRDSESCYDITLTTQ